MLRISVVCSCVLMLGALTAPTESATQQVPGHAGVGFVINGPQQLLGGSAHVVLPRWGGIGLYVDAKFDSDSPRSAAGFESDLTAAEVDESFGHPLFEEQSSWRSVNAALLRPLTPELVIYAGAGMSEKDAYRHYEDPEFELGESGLYWVTHEEESSTEMNLLGGAFFRLTPRFWVHFGVEAQPRGMTVGGSYTVPLR